MAQIIDGKALAEELRGEIRERVADFKKERGKLLLKTGILSHVPTLTSKIK